MKDIKIVGDRVIKCTSLQEARNLEYVQNKVSCPKIYDYYTKNSKFYIEMEYIPGKTLCDIWPELSEEQKQIVTDNILNELNKLRKETLNEICGINNTVIDDPLFEQMRFKSEKELNKHISSMVQTSKRSNRLIYEVLPTDSKICLSHGELSYNNIIVRENLAVVFINWHCMGFLPEYWDLMKAFIYNSSNDEVSARLVFQDHVDKNAIMTFSYVLDLVMLSSSMYSGEVVNELVNS
ncbi:kinase-like protein [Ascoidea rubescens DSM 1968]|uniref:Kinase-like protein n=1 Tax=Ascoidea rubescens DSM 1968 TaxID=1344418 RepID=A0A1D2VDN5_9ASCO|nr:kinase-like protein [Ascoidea rubescens DSM 1968]ODV59745.1 kinase-like protein [Ascoidea rubescens DSM 1968]